MHPDLEQLVVLQRLDSELRVLREEVSATPARIAAVAANVAAAQAAQLKIEEALAAEEKQRRALQSDVKTLSERAGRLRRQMDAVTTTAQAAALEHEISFVTAEIVRLEDRELESMERSETLEGTLPAARATVAQGGDDLGNARVRGAEQTEANQARIAVLADQRTALRATVAEAALGTYDRIARSRGTAVAEGVDGRCSACQMAVRPQRWNDLRDRSRDDLMLTCESCGRLLYWDPARDAPQRKPIAGETRPAEREESIAARIVRSL